MEEIENLIKEYGLQEDEEYIIIPYTDIEGHNKRKFVLKRQFVRIMYGEDFFVDYPIADVILSIIKYPELSIKDALHMMNKDRAEVFSNVSRDESKIEEQ